MSSYQAHLHIVKPGERESTLAWHISDFILSRRAADRSPATIAFYEAILGELDKFAPRWPLIPQ